MADRGCPVIPLAERFWPKVNKDGPIPAYAPHLGRCWLWVAGINSAGYGTIGRGRRADGRVYAHVWAWVDANGPVPQGLELDHLCRVTHCVNPAHLEPVTRAENIRRGYAAKAQTHCKRGHDLALAYVTKDGRRDCRMCKEIRKTETRPGWTIEIV